ncbi:MAG TPA: hypothetical protein VF719_11980 [Abditibacteriaceae bacterium]|jgi:hypothetical protein
MRRSIRRPLRRPLRNDRRNTSVSARPAVSPLARVLVSLLALMQFVAPTWHVCEMAGPIASCHPHGAAETHASNPHSHDASQPQAHSHDTHSHSAHSHDAGHGHDHHSAPATRHSHHGEADAQSAKSHPRCEDGEKCVCPTGGPAIGGRAADYPETCLAKLLWNFPAQSIAAISFDTTTAERRVHFATRLAFSPSFLSRDYPARGPPLLIS